MWELARVQVSDRDNVEKYLREGYEPFAISDTAQFNFPELWLKRKVKDAVHSEQGHNEGRSGEAPKKSEGENKS